MSSVSAFTIAGRKANAPFVARVPKKRARRRARPASSVVGVEGSSSDRRPCRSRRVELTGFSHLELRLCSDAASRRWRALMRSTIARVRRARRPAASPTGAPPARGLRLGRSSVGQVGGRSAGGGAVSGSRTKANPQSTERSAIVTVRDHGVGTLTHPQAGCLRLDRANSPKAPSTWIQLRAPGEFRHSRSFKVARVHVSGVADHDVGAKESRKLAPSDLLDQLRRLRDPIRRAPSRCFVMYSSIRQAPRHSAKPRSSRSMPWRQPTIVGQAARRSRHRRRL